MPTLLSEAEGNIAGGAIASCWRTPRGRRPRACTETPCARTGRSRRSPVGRWRGGPRREGRGRTPMMNERGKSDGPVVPAKPPNKAGRPAAEVVEGRGLAKGNTASKTRPGHRAGTARQVRWSVYVKQHEGTRKRGSPRSCTTSTVERLRAAYLALKPEGRAGSRRRDVASTTGRTWRTTSRICTPAASRSVPSEAVSEGVHPEGGRAATAARHRRAGGQDRPARRGRGAQRDLRGGLPRLLLRVPAGAQPARRAGCARGRDHAEEGELGARRRHP